MKFFKGLKFVKLTVFAVLLTFAAWVLPADIQEAAAASDLQSPRISDEITTWDCVYFGRYPQNSDGKGSFITEPIKWRVLSADGDRALLLSDKNLDARAYNEEQVPTTWESSSVRKWLNGIGPQEFIGKAFSSEEQQAIAETTLRNPDNPVSGISGGNATVDKVFFLSADEAASREYGFPLHRSDSETRQALNTDYVKSQGVFTSNSCPGMGSWWLRSPGHLSTTVSFAGFRGNICSPSSGEYVNDISETADRPALYLDLNSDCWSYAGTVSSDGTATGAAKIKADQYITCASAFTKVYGAKAFNLNAAASGTGTLTYKSDDTSVVRVNSDGLASLKGPGKATVTITAEANDDYNEASKEVTITVKPKKAALKKAVSLKKGTLTAVWKKDPKASGYEVTAARDSKFKSGVTGAVVKNGKTTTATIKKMLKSNTTYYVKVRAYKKGRTAMIYGAYSKAVKVKVK